MSVPHSGSGTTPQERGARSRRSARPRLGFLGVGWIGRHRLEAVVRSELAEIAAVSDPDPEAVRAAQELAPGAAAAEGLEGLLARQVDGVVIATPSAQHAAQAVRALGAGVAVFCQKPLARSARETAPVVEAARRANRLLGVDLSYRFTSGMQEVRSLVSGGDLGRVYAADLVFHNAYGPDKPWFYDPKLSGGGCVMDLGIHLVDLALWTLGHPRVSGVSSRLFAAGAPLQSAVEQVEDYAVAELALEGGAVVRLACSWKLPAGCDCVIEASFYGTRGGATFRNVNGSFYDFLAEHHAGTSRRRLCEPPDAWGGRAAVDWVSRLAAGEGFDPAIEEAARVAEVLDRIRGAPVA